MSNHHFEPDCESNSQTQCYEEAFSEYEKQRGTAYPALSFMLQKGLKSFWYIYVVMTTALTLHFAFYTYQDCRSERVGTSDQRKTLLGVAEDSTGFIPNCNQAYFFFHGHATDHLHSFNHSGHVLEFVRILIYRSC
jgi:hypothetical protein